VRIVTRFVGCDVEALRVDQPVHAVFAPLAFPGDARRPVAPLFTPCDTVCAHSTTKESP
jgi:hypothetical protein